MKRLLLTLLMTLITTVGGVLLSPGSVFAQTSTTTASGFAFSGNSANGMAVCYGKADSPHYSKGANSVIFKARIHCDGDGGTVQYTLVGWMDYASGGSPGHPGLGPYERVFTSKSQTQAITVNKGDTTFYIPAPGETHLRAGGTFCPGFGGGPQGGDQVTIKGLCNGT